VRILALDVSSSATGWAVLDGAKPVLEAFDLIRPPARLDSVVRIDAMVARVGVIAEDYAPDAVVMEWSSGKVHGRLGRIPGLAVLGQAQGAVRAALRAAEWPVKTVSENDWTGGKSKARRSQLIACEFPAYGRWSGNDPGFDVADAIGIGCWWLRREWVMSLVGEAAQ
jgi:Holliday junction resolvasome RuvABC endonuclease subunit